MRTLAALVLAAALVALWAPAAGADGLPVFGVDVGGTGVEDGERTRYVTFTLSRSTVLARVEQHGGRVRAWRTLRGRYTIPAVAYDGSAAGLSRDGHTLVLVRPREVFPQRRTRFAVISAPSLRVRRTLELPGDFSFDAISPDGRWLYLVQYLSATDPTKYLVRLYDLRHERMRREPVIDPREVGDVMRGEPVSRATSADGRWAYTLYDGAGGHPFVHALDTAGRTARCIDLHDLRGYQVLADLRLSLAGEVLEVRHVDGELVARIDTAAHEVLPQVVGRTEPPAKETAAAPARDAARELLALVVPGFALAGAAVLLARTRRRP